MYTCLHGRCRNRDAVTDFINPNLEMRKGLRGGDIMHRWIPAHRGKRERSPALKGAIIQRMFVFK